MLGSCSKPSPDSVAMRIEVSGGKLNLLVQAAESEPVTLLPGKEPEQVAAAIAEAKSAGGACAIVLPDDGAPLATVVEALRLSQSAGTRPVGFVRSPGLSVWTKVKQDPDVKGGALDQSMEEFGKSRDSIIGQGLTPVIQLQVGDDLPQPKVIEFLNLLSGRGIKNVTLMDLK